MPVDHVQFGEHADDEFELVDLAILIDIELVEELTARAEDAYRICRRVYMSACACVRAVRG